MEEAFKAIKAELLTNFWKDKFVIIGQEAFPRKKYKSLKVLSLTNSRNIDEIKLLVKEHLSTKELLYAWCYNSIEAYSLASEAKCNEVVGDSKFEDMVLFTNPKINSYFPFHILNLDFTSQGIEISLGRLEKELHTVEKVIIKQKETFNNTPCLILVTTLIDSTPINSATIKSNSDQYASTSWTGLNVSGSIGTVEEKIAFAQQICEQLMTKYNLNVEISSTTKDINSHKVLSISIVIKGSR
ncbi:hypothetical protein COY26_03390 [Candidatus Woesearchaeota archaeon CG_4_10_14_0_2_um_filter_33_10]|nr:MAG: hypothetical protein AUJ83_04265 [Candidatus Woesearchaeota archaeon CG1_02_33_12]PIU72137.1 MAG: hypothetical protein COS79_04485 [Candidatus Woesearchaeota archaeon CG06_land_8_20_14_3_00_33_13]PIZ52859.1 MAG: hypothetical protein COY26_03390 [Candidatus Woesearchaeota archaeon CG_4_10_14_0_2_um_filter_33_10]